MHFFPIKVSWILLYNSLILYIEFIGIYMSLFSLFVCLCFLNRFTIPQIQIWSDKDYTSEDQASFKRYVTCPSLN